MMVAKHIRKLEGYVPGEQPRSRRVVKLNTNENPYPPSPKCAKALADFDASRLRRYPDPDCNELRAVLAKMNGTVPERVFVGNGSDEILSLAARCFVEDDEALELVERWQEIALPLDKPKRAYGRVRGALKDCEVRGEVQRRRHNRRGVCRLRA